MAGRVRRTETALAGLALVVAVHAACFDRRQNCSGQDGAASRLDEIRERVEAARDRLRSLRVDYTAHIEPIDADFSRVSFAAKGIRRYIRREKVLVRGNGFDPFTYESFYTGNEWNVYSPNQRKYEISRRFAIPEHTSKARGHAFAEVFGWWPPDDDSAPPRNGDQPIFLHELLQAPDCRAEAVLERVGEHQCSIVKVGASDVLWIDAQTAALVRHERHFGGDLLCRFDLDDYRQVADQIWLPYLIRRFVPSSSSPESVFEVQSYVVNDVPETTFQFTPPPGTLVFDRDTDSSRQIPGGMEFLHHVSAAVQGISAEVNNRAARPRISSLTLAFLEGAGVVLGAGLAIHVMARFVKSWIVRPGRIW